MTQNKQLQIIRVKLFASFKEIVGKSEVSFEIEKHATISDLKKILLNNYPRLSSQKFQAIYAVNHKVVDDSTLLSADDEIAIFPPVSGGTISITEKPIDLNDILLHSKDESAGATTLFLGTVRDHNDGQVVSGIHYEAYKEMSESVLLEIESEVLKKWDIKKFIAIHRIGDLKIGDVSVAVSISTEHRKDAFEACRYTIDAIKIKVPIWKKEKTVIGQHWVQTK